MPERPNATADQGRRRIAKVSGELRNEQAAPANLFSQGRGTTANDSGGCGKREIENNHQPIGQIAQAKTFSYMGDEVMVVKAATTKYPHRYVCDSGIKQGNEITPKLIKWIAPFPAESGNGLAEDFFSEDARKGRRPHDTEDVRAASRTEMAGFDNQKIKNGADRKNQQEISENLLAAVVGAHKKSLWSSSRDGRKVGKQFAD